jgi:hypothetical protein
MHLAVPKGKDSSGGRAMSQITTDYISDIELLNSISPTDMQFLKSRVIEKFQSPRMREILETSDPYTGPFLRGLIIVEIREISSKKCEAAL